MEVVYTYNSFGCESGSFNISRKVFENDLLVACITAKDVDMRHISGSMTQGILKDGFNKTLDIGVNDEE